MTTMFPIKLTPKQDAAFPVVWRELSEDFFEQYRNAIQQRLGMALDTIREQGGITLYDLAAVVSGHDTADDIHAIVMVQVAVSTYENALSS